jgi:hypothetical protein
MTEYGAGALTVAGQWRIYTAFPFIPCGSVMGWVRKTISPRFFNQTEINVKGSFSVNLVDASPFYSLAELFVD